MNPFSELVTLVEKLQNSITDRKVRELTLPVHELAIKVQQTQLDRERERLEETTRLHSIIATLQEENTTLKSLTPQIPDHSITPRPLDPCPFCRLDMGILLFSAEVPGFGAFGKKINHFKCSNPSCGSEYQKKNKE